MSERIQRIRTAHNRKHTRVLEDSGKFEYIRGLTVLNDWTIACPSVRFLLAGHAIVRVDPV